MVSAQLQMFGFFRRCAARHLVHHLQSKNTPNGREDATEKLRQCQSVACVSFGIFCCCSPTRVNVA